MKVLVTGGSGRLGQGTVAELIAHGHEVVNADQRRAVDLFESVDANAYRQARFVQTDLGDVGQVAGAMAGCDGVIHLGAIPSPGSFPDEVVFRNNTGATFAVLHAAELLGIKKAVIASSLSALGTAWATDFMTPVYAPVDEAHPLLNHDCYGLSKEVDERTAEMFHRRTEMQVVALRFTWVATPSEVAARAKEDADDPERARVLWSYVDLRDAALACRLAIEAEGLGFIPFNVVANDSTSSQPTEELIRKHAPDTEIRSPMPGTASAFSIERIRERLGFEPRHSWR